MVKRRKSNKQKFILLSFSLSVFCAIIISVVIIPRLGVTLCGFVPITLVAIACGIGQLVGTVYYIIKHKYAYGEVYEGYQIVNSLIYGIQNILRVMLSILLINICAIPVFIIIVIIYSIFKIKKIFKS